MDDLTKCQFNSSYIAHIVADKPTGPRGHPTRSEELKSDLRNLMLLCDVHHRLVDIANIGGHPESLLLGMKAEHEARTERLGGIARHRMTDLLLYGANIGDAVRLPTFAEAAEAVLPDWYPASDRPFELSLKNSHQTDRSPEFWAQEAQNLRHGFERLVRPGLLDHSIRHLSVFGLAPQPLLVLLGSLIGDLVPAEVFQRHREPPTWNWPTDGDSEDLICDTPERVGGPPAILLALSATVTRDRVAAVLGADPSVWTVTIKRPHNDYLKHRAQLAKFRRAMRGLLNEIKASYSSSTVLHVFPAAPVAVCVELGRVLMPKADMPLRVYDEVKQRGGFVHALDLNA